LDRELTALYSQSPKEFNHTTVVPCSTQESGQVEFRSSFFLSGQNSSTPKSEHVSLLQQIENSPTKKRVDDRSRISTNPFAVKTSPPPSPVLNRFTFDAVEPDPIYHTSPIKMCSAAGDSLPLTADSDEGTFLDLSIDESQEELTPRPNLSRFKYRRPLFSQSSGSVVSPQEDILISSPEKSPIIKRKRNENFSPSRRLVSK